MATTEKKESIVTFTPDELFTIWKLFGKSVDAKANDNRSDISEDLKIKILEEVKKLNVKIVSEATKFKNHTSAYGFQETREETSSLLHLAVKSSSYDLCKWLLENGASVNALESSSHRLMSHRGATSKSMGNRTPTHYLFKERKFSLPILECLLSYGVDFSISESSAYEYETQGGSFGGHDSEGWTPFHAALKHLSTDSFKSPSDYEEKRQQHYHILNLLFKKGVNPHLTADYRPKEEGGGYRRKKKKKDEQPGPRHSYYMISMSTPVWRYLFEEKKHILPNRLAVFVLLGKKLGVQDTRDRDYSSSDKAIPDLSVAPYGAGSVNTKFLVDAVLLTPSLCLFQQQCDLPLAVHQIILDYIFGFAVDGFEDGNIIYIPPPLKTGMIVTYVPGSKIQKEFGTDNQHFVAEGGFRLENFSSTSTISIPKPFVSNEILSSLQDTNFAHHVFDSTVWGASPTEKELQSGKEKKEARDKAQEEWEKRSKASGLFAAKAQPEETVNL